MPIVKSRSDRSIDALFTEDAPYEGGLQSVAPPRGKTAQPFADVMDAVLAEVKSTLLEEYNRHLGHQFQVLRREGNVSADFAMGSKPVSQGTQTETHGNRGMSWSRSMQGSGSFATGSTSFDTGSMRPMSSVMSSITELDAMPCGTMSAAPRKSEARRVSFLEVGLGNMSSFAHMVGNTDNRKEDDTGRESASKRRTQVARVSGASQEALVTIAPQSTPAVRMMRHLRAQPAALIDSLMTVVIVLNAAVIGISTDTASWSGWLPIDGVFLAFFLMEFIAKIIIVGCKGYFWGSDFLWGWFEMALLLLSIVEIISVIYPDMGETLSGTSLFRVFRLARLTKLLRICRVGFVQDLVMMINGTMGGMSTMFWSILVVSLPMYVVALVLRETLGQLEKATDGAEHFTSLGESFFTVFRCLVPGDCNDSEGRPIFVHIVARYGWLYGLLYSFTCIFMSFGLFNVIVAIYVENTVAASKSDDMNKKRDRLKDEELYKQKSLELMLLAYSLKCGLPLKHEFTLTTEDLTAIKEVELTRPDYALLCQHQEFSELLTDLDIQVDDQLGLFDVLDVDQSGTLDIAEICHGIRKLRGEPRKSDVASVILTTQHISTCLMKFQKQVMSSLASHSALLNMLTDGVYMENGTELTHDDLHGELGIESATVGDEGTVFESPGDDEARGRCSQTSSMSQS